MIDKDRISLLPLSRSDTKLDTRNNKSRYKHSIIAFILSNKIFVFFLSILLFGSCISGIFALYYFVNIPDSTLNTLICTTLRNICSNNDKVAKSDSNTLTAFITSKHKCTDAMKYIIVIDSGSSGSRLFIYSWSDNDTKMDQLPKFRLLWSMTMWMGLSHFLNNSESSISSYINSLLEFALTALGNDSSRTPLYILATAGMRLLSDQDQETLKELVCSTIHNSSYPFLFDCNHFQVITGEQEGIYGWLSVNYMMDRLYPNSQTVGFMDLGGASLQLAYEPGQKDLDLYSNNTRIVSITPNIKRHVFVTSLIGLGTIEARKRYLKTLPDWYNSTSDHISDPCVPLSATVPFDDELFSYNHISNNITKRSVQGIGKFHACMNQTKKLLDQYDLNVIPSLPQPMTIVGISDFFNTMHDVFDFGGIYDPELFLHWTKKFCHTPWNKLRHYYHATHEPNHYNDIKLKKQCFKSAWIMTLLHELLHIPKERPPYQSIEFVTMKNVQDMDISWTLGAVLTLYHKVV